MYSHIYLAEMTNMVALKAALRPEGFLSADHERSFGRESDLRMTA